jgi:hypothetical protein
MSHERDQAKLQRHIREAEDRATAGGHELRPLAARFSFGPLPGGSGLSALWREVQAGYRALYVAFDRVCPGTGEG